MKKTYVLGFCFTEDGKSCFLIRKAKPGWQRGLVNGIGGHMEPGETPVQAMVREFHEEVGLMTKPEDWEVRTILASQNWEMYVYSSYMRLSAPYSPREIDEGCISLTDEMPTEQTARWLYWLCLDMSRGGYWITGV